ncbi:MAG: hypothetical protein SGJ10_13240 [Bacteroidota bacterium]|nr:hypothetical protein [Bacteroidota bacterium]
MPANGLAGTPSLDVIVRGTGTHWDGSMNKANVNFTGGGINVNNINVTGPEMIIVNIAIDAAASGDRILTIGQGSNTYTASQPFSVISNSSPLSISLMVNPVQSINISDFDPNNLGSSPVLFSVSIYNNAISRSNLTATLSVRGEKVGKVGTATKKISSLSANQHLAFNNKEFDSYNLDQTNKEFFNNAINTGTLPADDYDYTLTLTDQMGNTWTGSAKTVLSNPTTRPELITPGSNISMPAEALRNPIPVFQWFSQGDNFELTVYPVMAGQTTAEEVTNNRPMYKQSNILTTTFSYPSSAEVLIDGKLYAWQIKRMITSSTGNNLLSSEVFWFRYQSAGKPILSVSDIKITPEESTVPSGGSFKFNAQAFSVNNEIVTDAVISWKVVPASAGTIDNTGLFTASNTPGSAAIVAKVGEYQEYATVTIAPAYMGTMTEASMRLFIEKLFGLTK